LMIFSCHAFILFLLTAKKIQVLNIVCFWTKLLYYCHDDTLKVIP